MVTIITTIFNANIDDFKQTFDSVLKQSYADFEYIIQSAGKSEECENYVLRCNDPRVRLSRKSDSGIYDGMNIALDYSSHKYVLFLNSGDFFVDIEFISDAISILRASNHFKIVACENILYGDSFEKSQVRRQKKSDFLIRGICHQSFIADMDHVCFDLSYQLAADFKSILDVVDGDLSRIFYIKNCGVFYKSGGVSDENNSRVYLEMCRIIISSKVPFFRKVASSLFYLVKFLFSFRF